jgi:hypothetical protein
MQECLFMQENEIYQTRKYLKIGIEKAIPCG